MDTSTIKPQHLEAGKEYDEALVKLGLTADAVLWAYDRVVGHHVLVVVTDFFDFKGPLEISEKLFMAYNAAATPKEIDPFAVRLQSINQPLGEWCHRFAGGMNAAKHDPVTKKPAGNFTPIEGIEIDGLQLNNGWVIVVRPRSERKPIDLIRRWKRFSKNVEKAAA